MSKVPMAGRDKGNSSQEGGELFDIPEGPCSSKAAPDDQPGTYSFPRGEAPPRHPTAASDNRKCRTAPLMEKALREAEQEMKQLSPPPPRHWL
jgi:hypothetical protein